VLNRYEVPFRVMHGYAWATAIQDVVLSTLDGAKALTVLRGEGVPGGEGRPLTNPAAAMRETINRYTKPINFGEYIDDLCAQHAAVVVELRMVLGGRRAAEPAPRPAEIVPVAERPRRARTVMRDERDDGRLD
jgi:hypothetical protein